MKYVETVKPPGAIEPGASVSYPMTPDEIYGPGWSKMIPEGYFLVGFRVPRDGDVFLPKRGALPTTTLGSHDYPRLILAKGEERVTKPSDVYRFMPCVPRGFRVVDFRPLRLGDQYIGRGDFQVWDVNSHTTVRRGMFGEMMPIGPRLIVEPTPTQEDFWE